MKRPGLASRRLGLSLAVAILVIGCKENLQKADAPATGTPATADGGGKPAIACDEAVFNYGTVPQGTDVKHVFTVKNMGDAVLHVNSARGG